MTRLVLFDVDGTLILTGGAGLRAMDRAFQAVFGPAGAFAGVAFHGRTDRSILADALARLGLEARDGQAEQFRRAYCAALREEILKPGPRKGVLPGVRPLVERLAADDRFFPALLTGNYAEGARIKLEHFDLWRYFRCGAFADDSAERNDLAAVALERARACGLPPVAPRDVVVVGDTPLDVACAAAAGARCVAVATGGYDVDALRRAGADAVFPDLSDTAAVLEAIRG
ncbi:MAG TPA: HAD hydrolase-like protein [Vicinamibacterales bacterium]|nr:HAD hydrolase-like protein [Vicinamibacterales bacterium]